MQSAKWSLTGPTIYKIDRRYKVAIHTVLYQSKNNIKPLGFSPVLNQIIGLF